MNISRRNLLRMMGLAGAAYGASMLGGVARPARAGDPPIPRRIVFFYTDQGTVKSQWAPNAPGAPAATSITTPWSTTAHTLGPLHEALVTWKNKLLFLDGLDMRSSYVDPTAGANGHINGETHSLTAAFRQTASLAGGPSIDQFIAKAINAPAAVTAVPSLELYVQGNGADSGGESHPIYADAGQPVPVRGDPRAIYDRLFPNGPKGTTPEQQAKLARLLAERRSALRYASADFASVASKMSKLDRQRLEAHAAAVSELDGRLSLGSKATCVEPTKADATSGANTGDFNVNADIMMRLTQTALACDLTRVVTLYVPEPPGDVFGYQQVNGTSGYHDMIHRVVGGSGSPPDLDKDTAALAVVNRYYNYLAAQYAKLLDLLNSIPEADGSTLLDHTAVVWCGQLAQGDHSVGRLPYVIGGGMGGALTTGRYVRYPRTPSDDYLENFTTGLAHNDLFVALAQGMGVQTNTFGEASVCKGALAGLK